MTSKRIRKASAMTHVQVVSELPRDGRYVPLKKFLLACPAARVNKDKVVDAIHYLVERKYLTVVAKPVLKRARRLYDREQIPLVRQMLAMHANGLTLDKAYEIASKRLDQKRLF
jgi:hypothetical protein